MVVHIAECVLGVFAFDDGGWMLGSKQFPRSVVEVARKLASIQTGTPTSEHRELIAELIERGHEEFTFESEGLVARLRDEFRGYKFKTELPNEAGKILRSELRGIADQLGFKGVEKFVRDVNLLLTRERLRAEAAERDELIIQAINTLDEIDRTCNTICGRIREWYSIHFPEFDRLVSDHKTFLESIVELGTRERFTKGAVEAATGLPEEEVERITAGAESSLGAPFDEHDIEALRGCAKEVIAMYEVRDKMAEYIDGLMAQIAPNLRAVVGSSIGARLISLAGGLRELARLPASTIQLLGAEKALFRALRTRGKPPKHGVIYQHPEIRGAPRWQRGKMARAFAGKLTIAARVDAMSGEFIGDKLVADLRTRMGKIRSKPKAPER